MGLFVEMGGAGRRVTVSLKHFFLGSCICLTNRIIILAKYFFAIIFVCFGFAVVPVT